GPAKSRRRRKASATGGGEAKGGGATPRAAAPGTADPAAAGRAVMQSEPRIPEPRTELRTENSELRTEYGKCEAPWLSRASRSPSEIPPASVRRLPREPHRTGECWRSAFRCCTDL